MYPRIVSTHPFIYSSMYPCIHPSILSYLVLSCPVSAVIGYSIPSFFGYLVTRNPLEGLFRLATLGQADRLVQLASSGRWESLSALWGHVEAELQLVLTSVPVPVPVLGGEGVAALHAQSVRFLQRAAATQNLITIPDLLVIGAGYLVFVLDSVVLSVLTGLLGTRFTRGRRGRKLSLLLDTVAIMVDVVKIGVLLGVRIFLLPCIVGLVIYHCWNSFLFGYEVDVLVDFCINNVVGCISVLWGMGISFMLFSTIAILQLREILHPSFLARFIRPQESQSDLLTSLLQGTGQSVALTHSLTHSLVHSLTQSLTHSLTHLSLTHSPIAHLLLTHSLSHPLTHPLLHSLHLHAAVCRHDSHPDKAPGGLFLRVLAVHRSLRVPPPALRAECGRRLAGPLLAAGS
jgi:hypothetical protein